MKAVQCHTEPTMTEKQTFLISPFFKKFFVFKDNEISELWGKAHNILL